METEEPQDIETRQNRPEMPDTGFADPGGSDGKADDPDTQEQAPTDTDEAGRIPDIDPEAIGPAGGRSR